MAVPPDILAHIRRQETLSVGDRVLKSGGDYEAEGEVRAVLTKRDGAPRIVVEFDVPRGLLFVMRPDQVERAESAGATGSAEKAEPVEPAAPVDVRALAEAHWGYVRSVLKAHDEDGDAINKCGFHYVTAFEHGFKHGVESTRGTGR